MKRQLLLAVAIRFTIYFVHWMTLAYLPVIFKSNGLVDWQIGLLISFFALASMALMLPMGIFSDYFSPKLIILLGALAYALYFLLLPRFHSFHVLALLVVLGGSGAAALIVVSESMYLKVFGHKRPARWVAFYQVATYLGFGLGAFVGSYLLDHGDDLIFMVASLGAGLICFAALFLEDTARISFSFNQYGDDLRQLKPALLIACIFLLGTHFGVEQTTISLWMREGLDLSHRQIGLLFGQIGCFMATTVLFVGWLRDKKEKLFVFLLVGLLISGFFQMITGLAAGYWSLLIIRLLHTLGDTIALLELSVLTAILFPAHRLGGNSGFLYGVRTLATFGAAALSGWLNGAFSYETTFFVSGALLLLFVIIVTIWIKISKQRKQVLAWS